MSKVIGIDLGTTKSVAVVMEGGNPRVIPNQEGSRTTPSIVAFTSKGETLIGQIARRQAVTNPENTVYGVKRLVGRRFDSTEVKAATRLCPYRIVAAANGDAHIQIDDRIYSPSEIEAIILRKLKDAAEDYLGEPVEEAIISVPAYFNDLQRQATRDAGSIAGLKVQRILNEATAAALAFGMTLQSSGKVAIYDLGGGTFDISILELQEGIYQVLATAGDTYLGGEDFDELIINWLVEQFRKDHEIDLTGDRMALQRLKEAAEKAKCELSTQLEAEITLPYITASPREPKHLTTVLTRTKFEQMIQPMLDYTATLCRNAIRDAGIETEDIDEVVPVGGQTRTPAVMKAIGTTFGKEPNRRVNPDEVVSIGTAIQTGILEGEVTDLVLLDVTPHTLGIETRGGTFTPIIERNSSIPTKKTRIFTTVADNQTDVEVHVLQGEGFHASENTSLGQFMLTGLPPSAANEPEIEVAFEIDVNGILRVEAMDRATGRQKDLTVRPSSGLTPSDIETARRRVGPEVALLQGLLRSTRKTLELLNAKLTDEERDAAEQVISAAENSMEGSLEGIQAALSDLDIVAKKMGQAMLRD